MRLNSESASIFSASQAKTKGVNTKYDIGVKYAEKQQRKFTPEKMKEGRSIIGLQVCLILVLHDKQR